MQAGLPQHVLDIVDPAAVDRLHRGPRPGVDRGPAADGLLQRRLAAERPAHQQRQRVAVPGGGLEAGNDLFGGDLAPMLEDRGVERGNIGKVPVETAARHPHRLGQRFRLQRREAAFGQRLEALIEPVFAES